jgi:hypothetical protein
MEGNSMSAMIYTLALYRAKQVVKQQIRKEGKKLQEFKARDITILAQLWLDVHREEAIADAKQSIARSPELTKMFEREQKQTVRRAQ